MSETSSTLLIFGYIKENIILYIPEAIIHIIIQFFGDYDISFKSDILGTNDDKFQFIEMLSNQLNKNTPLINETKSYKLERIYSSKNNGLTAHKFHELCDNKGPTISLIINHDDSIFGGYTSISWKSNNRSSSLCYPDSNAFLYQLKPNIKIFELKNKDHTKAVRHNKSFLIGFGSGCDLIIKESPNKNFARGGAFNFEYGTQLVGGKFTRDKTKLFGVVNMETFKCLTLE